MLGLSSEQGRLLFDKISDTVQQPGLTEKERIPKYRSVLEELYKTLTATVKTHFGNLHSRMLYVENEGKAPEAINRLAKSLRIAANEVVHNADAAPTPLDDARCIYCLCQTIGHFAGTETPERLRDCYEYYLDDIQADLRKKQPRRPRHNFRAVVRSVYVPADIHKTAHCIVTCDTDELGTVELGFWDNRKADGYGSDLSQVAIFLEPYHTLFVTAVIQDPHRENRYNTTDTSYVVLEPDYLIEARQLASCCQPSGDKPLLHLLNRFAQPAPKKNMLFGLLAGAMLDEMVTHPKQYDYEKVFDKFRIDQAFPLLCEVLREGAFNPDSVTQMREEAQWLEPNIRFALQQLQDKRLLVEPTFLSSNYGLQGRLDLLLQDPNNPLRLDVVEMKASFQVRGIKPDHEAQALAYSLLLESTFPGRQGWSAILYGKVSPKEEPLRQVQNDTPLRKQKLLMVRNMIVANELKLARGNMEPLFQLNPEDLDKAPTYANPGPADFQSVYQNLDTLQRLWFDGFVQFVFGEMVTAKVGGVSERENAGGFAALWNTKKAEKKEKYLGLFDLRLLDVSDDFHIRLSITTDLLNSGLSSLREGETAILYPTPNPESPQPLAQQILKCTVRRLQSDTVTVSLRHKQLDKSLFKKNTIWALESDQNESSYGTMLSLLYGFLRENAHKRHLVLGLRRPTFTDTAYDLSPDLNDNQRDIVRQALRAQDYFLVQGPPGTGKTSTVLRELVYQIAEKEQRNVMVIAFTNQAVRVIGDKLDKLGIPYIQLGRGDAPNSWNRLAAENKLHALHQKVSGTRVFLSTQATFAMNLDLLQFKPFHTLIVDEASQLLEPQLAGFIPKFERLIMIGDDKQLPAVVLQNEDATRCDHGELHAIALKNFRESLFARLLYNARNRGWTDAYGMLEVQYRMHEDIADFPNRQYYGGQLKIGGDTQRQPLVWPHSEHPLHHLFTRRVAFVPSRPDVRSKINEEEARLVVELIRYVHELYGDKFVPAKTVGVITPFRAQIAQIRKLLKGAYTDVTIDTVERFQGSERDVILVSFAVKSPLQLRAIQSINAEGVDRKLNVAMTRAKEHLVMVGVREVVGGVVFNEKVLELNIV